MVPLRSTEGISDARGFLVEAAELQRPEVDGPQFVIDLFQADEQSGSFPNGRPKDGIAGHWLGARL